MPVIKPFIAARSSQQGFTLVELMVGLVLGSFVVAAAMSATTSSLRHKSVESAAAQGEARALALFLERDVRRAGYWGQAAAGSKATPAAYNNPFSSLTVSAGCVLYSYDLDADGTLDTAAGADERFALALADGAVFQRKGGSDHNCDTTKGTWERLTNPATLRVSSLSFTVDQVLAPVRGSDRQVQARTLSYAFSATPVRFAGAALELSGDIPLPNDTLTAPVGAALP